jgi:hypothetical protein
LDENRMATALHGKNWHGRRSTPLKPTFKFALLSGILAAVAAALGSFSVALPRLSRHGDLLILASGLIFAIPVFFAPYIAGRKGWLTFSASLGRSLAAAIPLPFLPATFFIGLIGWGDMEEHLIRRLLHATHRELSSETVGVLIFALVTVFGAIALGTLLWISVSVLTKRWRARTLLIVCTFGALIVHLFWETTATLDGRKFLSIATSLVFVFASGFLFAFTAEMNATSRHLTLVFRVAMGAISLGVASGGAVLIAKSVPEKTYPKLANGPLWTFDIGSTGCRPVWGGGNSSTATTEIAFTTAETLGMAIPTAVNPLPNNKWEYKSCLFTIDANTGRKLAQISIDGNQQVIQGGPHGTFRVRIEGAWTAYTPDLKTIGAPEVEKKSAEHWTAARWHNFRTDSKGKLWLDGSGEPRLLAQYPGDAFIRPLGTERVLVTAGGQFTLFREDGTPIVTEKFMREGVHFAAMSADHRRFAVSVYLWGVGDPSYLEEEKIVVYDVETGKAIASVPSEPLPTTQSWAALSPDGKLLVVGARNTLRLFRLPSVSTNQNEKAN